MNPATTAPRAARIAVAIACAALAACSGAAPDDIDAWMRQQRAATAPSVTALSPFVRFTPLAYEPQSVADPFDSQKLAQVLRQDSGAIAMASRLLGPELQRQRQPLEAYPLDTIRMVGSLMRQGRRVALVRIDNQIHSVQVGQYLGQNYGRITRIADQEIQLREIVQDPAGEWIERPVTLPLQEKA